MSYDAAPREPAVHPRPAEPPASAPYRERRKKEALSAKRVIGILVVLGVSAIVVNKLKPNRGQRAREAEIEQIQAETRARHDDAISKLGGATLPASTGVASCDAMMTTLQSPPPCPTVEAAAELQKEVSAALERGMRAADANAACLDALTSIARTRTRLGCK